MELAAQPLSDKTNTVIIVPVMDNGIKYMLLVNPLDSRLQPELVGVWNSAISSAARPDVAAKNAGKYDVRDDSRGKRPHTMASRCGFAWRGQSMRISLCGAAQEVTGSGYLVETRTARVGEHQTPTFCD